MTTEQVHSQSSHIDPSLRFITQFLDLDEWEFFDQIGTSYEGYAFLELRGVEGLSTSQIEHLRAQGCLSLPPEEFLDHLVFHYFRFVHCHIPLLDEAEFWPAYKSSSSGAPSTPYTSLFVFQAVLFCSLAVCNALLDPFFHTQSKQACLVHPTAIDTHTRLRQPRTRTSHILSARKGPFYLLNRGMSYQLTVRQLLYELKAETDPLYLAQGCLLLSRHTTGAHPNQASEWLAIAINRAVSIQAHRAGISRSDEERKDNIKKRLWWSIIVRDRSLSLGLRRGILVAPPMLDLTTELPRESDFQDEIWFSRVHSPLDKKRFVHMLRAQVKLSLILTELLMHVTDNDVDEKDKNALNIGPQARESQALLSVNSKLCDWLRDTKDGLLLFEDIALQPLTQPTNLYSCLILLQFKYVRWSRL
jgi:hypothetical protein